MKEKTRIHPTIYDLILRANPDITDIRLIPDEQEILLPEIKRDSFVVPKFAESYKKSRETLYHPALLAFRMYVND